MKVLWLSNMIPGEVCARVFGRPGSGMWMDHVLEKIRQQKVELRMLCRGPEAAGELDAHCSYRLFGESVPYRYEPEQERLFKEELEIFRPDVVHIWGTEYAHCLAMVNACESLGFLNKTVISIQGLCSIISRHYCEGVPYEIRRRYTFRDFVRQDNILQQQKVFALRGENEVKALQKVRHVMGRTHWDRASMALINPQARYHHCGETLRTEFYTDTWSYEDCVRFRIFASSCSYPVKGFHYLLEAFAQLSEKYPQAVLAVPGKSFLDVSGFEKKLRRGSYAKYLAQLVQKHHLENRIEFLGGLDAQQMKQQYLKANVFVLPSTIENSPNSMAEAMLLGTPCVAADVGGVSTMMKHEAEGFVYQSTAPYMLAYHIDRVFSMEEKAADLGRNASRHAWVTHDPEKNLKDLLEVYQTLAQE